MKTSYRPLKSSLLILLLGLLFFACKQSKPEVEETKISRFTIDTTKANELARYAKSFTDENKCDTALTFFDQAFQLYEKQLATKADSSLRATYLHYKIVSADRGWALLRELDTAEYILNSAYQQSIEWFDTLHPMTAYATERMGEVKKLKREWGDAIDYFEGAARLYKKLGEYYSEKVINCQIIVSDILAGSMGQFVESIEYIDEYILPTIKHSSAKLMKFSPELHSKICYYYSRLGENQKAFDSGIKALELIDKYNVSEIIKPSINRTLGWIEIRRKNPESAMKYCKLALKQLSQYYPSNDYRITNTYDLLAGSYLHLGNTQKALELLHQSFNLKPPIEELRKYPGLGGNFLNFAQMYYELGDYQKASEYIEKSYLEQIRYYGNNNVQTNMIEGLKTKILVKIFPNNTSVLDTFITKHSNRNDLNGSDYYYISNAYRDKSIIQLENNDFSAATNSIKNALAINETVQNILVDDSNLYYIHLSKIKKAQELFEEAHFYLNKSHEINANISNTYYYSHLGWLYLAQRKYEKAIYYTDLQENFMDSSINDEASNLDSLSSNAKIKKESHLNLLSCAILSRYNYSFYLKDNLDILRQALIRCKLYNKIQEKILQELNREDSKLIWQEDQSSINTIGVKICNLLYEKTANQKYLDDAFYFTEVGKSKILREAINNQYALKVAGVPKPFLDSLQQVQALIEYYNQRLLNKKKEHRQNEFEQRLFDLKIQQDQMMSDLEQNHPDYYQLKYSTTLPTVDTIQAFLPNKNTALVEYLWGDSTLFSYTITKDTVLVHEAVIDSNLRQQLTLLDQFMQADTSGSEAKWMANKKQYQQVGYQLYQRLVAPTLHQLPAINHLILIPDGELMRIPFEVLLTENVTTNNFRDFPYLVKKYTVQHEYSANLLIKHRQSNSKQLKSILAFAPSFEVSDPEDKLFSAHPDSMKLANAFNGLRDDDSPLKYNGEEVKNINRTIGGSTLIGHTASEANFKSKASKYNILHIATHAYVSDVHPNYSYLKLAPDQDSTQDEMLHAYELYNMRLNADLAVLSACETGYGELQRGEGIMSLSRAFKYAGCPNIVTSLHKVDDQSTSQLMVNFYEQLKAGKGKADALQAAKLDFLATAEEKFTHPFYWGNFILIGDNEIVEIGNHYSRYWWFLGIVAMSLALFWGVRNRKVIS